MNNRSIFPARSVLVGFALLLMGGCAQLPRHSVLDDAPSIQLPTRPVSVPDGSIFQSGYGYQPPFEDRRPRNLGDTLTIVLDEQVSASKSSASAANRKGSTAFTPTTLPSQLKKISKLGVDVEGNSDFTGGGSSNANNTFSGTITVTVQEVMMNGNLRVRGEKHIGINQGKEYIRFSGYVNPRTITAQNTVPSTQVAEARIEYVGDGYINESQNMGWLQRIVLNISPF